VKITLTNTPRANPNAKITSHSNCQRLQDFECHFFLRRNARLGVKKSPPSYLFRPTLLPTGFFEFPTVTAAASPMRCIIRVLVVVVSNPPSKFGRPGPRISVRPSEGLGF